MTNMVAQQIEMEQTTGSSTEATVSTPAPPVEKPQVNEDSRFSKLAERTFLLAHYDWTPTASATNYNILDCTLDDGGTISDKSTLIQILRLYAYFRTDIRLTIVANGTAFQQGCLAITYVPSWDDTVDPVEPSTVALGLSTITSRPCIFVEPTTSSTMELNIPYNNVRSLLSTGRIDLAKSGNSNPLGIITVQPIQTLTVADGTTPYVSINIFVQYPGVTGYAFTNPALLPTGPNDTTFAEPPALLLEHAAGCQKCNGACKCANRGGKNVSISQAKQQGGNPFSGITDMLGLDLSSLTDFLPSVVEDLPGMLAGFLDRPDDANPATKVRRRTAGNMMSGIGTNDSTALAQTPNLVAPITNFPFADFDLKAQVTREAVFTSVDVPSSATENEVIVTFPVDPMYTVDNYTGVGDNTYLTRYHTPLSYVTSMFTRWSGSIHYRFRAICTSFSQCRLAILWRPNTQYAFNLPGGYLNNASYMHSKLWDIQGPCETTFDVPFASENAWNHVTSDINYQSGNPFAQKPYNSSNGCLSLVLVNRLVTASSSPPAIHILVSVSGGEDFELCLPSGQSTQDQHLDISPSEAISSNSAVMPNDLLLEVSALAPSISASVKKVVDFHRVGAAPRGGTQLVHASGESDSVLGRVALTQPHPDGEDHPENSNRVKPVSGLAARIYGESHMDLHQMIQRDQFLGNVSFAHNGGPARMFFIIPVTPQLFLGEISVDSSGAVTWPYSDTAGASGAQIGLTLLNKAVAPYAYWGGSLRYKIHIRGNTTFEAGGTMRAFFLPNDYELNDVDDRIQGKLTRYDVGQPAERRRCLYAKPHVAYVAGDSEDELESFMTNYGIQLESLEQQTMLDVRVPWYSIRQYATCTARQEKMVATGDPTDGSVNVVPIECVSGYLGIVCHINSQVNMTPKFEVWQAAGDDFVAGFYRGTPSTWTKTFHQIPALP
jgi:hypothetical protein